MNLLLLTVYLTWIAPLFNKYTELPEGELRTAIYELANRKEIDFPLTEIYQVDGSTRSAHSNAYDLSL
jgi:STE24 endopeptidase